MSPAAITIRPNNPFEYGELFAEKNDEDWARFRINITDIIGPKLRPNYFNGSWISGKLTM